jgi:predicted DNA-binding transcriptional regulator AlpA
VEKLLTAAEVAALVRKSLPSFYQLRHKKEGPPAVRVDGRLLFRPADVAEWIASRVERVEGRASPESVSA